MIKRFLAWFKGSPYKKSEQILSSFHNNLKELQSHNLHIAKLQQENLAKRHALEAEQAQLSEVFVKNAKVSQNIAKLLEL